MLSFQCYGYATQRYWSLANDWTFGNYSKFNFSHRCLLLLTPILAGVKPGDNTDIVIPVCIKMIIDEPLPRIRTLVIQGVLEFQRVCFFCMQISFSYHDFRVEITRCMSITLLLIVVY